jgi:serine/threonine-protein kinase HipA
MDYAFSYLFSNGNAHFKIYSLLETPIGDYCLSPAYDLLNSRIHIADKDFALDDGMLSGNLTRGKIRQQFIRKKDIPISHDLKSFWSKIKRLS